MTSIINNIQKFFLVDTENTQIAISTASMKMNEAPVRTSKHTVGEMAHGKFRRRFDRHHTAFRFFN